MQSVHDQRPRLRQLDVQLTTHQGQEAFVLRDLARIAEQVLLVPRSLGAILIMCDGSYTVREIFELARSTYRMDIEYDELLAIIRTLDEALMLENERFFQAYNFVLDAYRAAEYREPSHADLVYPSEPAALDQMLQGYIAHVPPSEPLQTSGKALFSPHIDYARGGQSYAAVWAPMRERLGEIDLAIILATNHHPSDQLFTLTRQNFRTPYGILPTDQAAVDILAGTIGEQDAFAHELTHRSEHSIELVAVWLHAMREGKPCRIVPVLCGSYGPFIQSQSQPTDSPIMRMVIAQLRDLLRRERAIIIASGDLSHVGPAFGGQAYDQAGWDQIAQSDAKVLEHLCAGDADGFYAELAASRDATNICGLAPFYLALKAIGHHQGELLAYQQCPADADGHSLVSVCGIAY
jgi:AmmeMemoRadiSam system protein B